MERPLPGSGALYAVASDARARGVGEFLHKPSRTLLIADFIQNYPAIAGDTLGNLAKAIGGVLNGGVPRDIRWSFIDRSAARASLEQILAWDFDRLIVAHGACVERDAKTFVRNAFAWLL